MIRYLSAVALLAASVLALAATPATAATGHLVLRSAEGSSVLSNPRPGCYSTTRPFSAVTNDTDSAVTVYTGTGCAGLSQIVQPGRTATVGERRSVFVPS
ncbi:hypothetical protein [Microtetraspora malaysiensis]|uniref:hypothetical protein n=1 Tax=Microtetraspora malaysiensis TaxID=161358 RepID=UPI003D8C06B5